MSSSSNLKTRVASATSTQKIVKAMDLVATSKIKKAKEKKEAVEFFQKTINLSLNKLTEYIDYQKHFKLDPNGDTICIVITSDMGLCGGYNHNVIKKFLSLYDTSYDNIVLGTKGISKLKYEKINIDNAISNVSDTNELEIAQDIFNRISDKMSNSKIRDIKIIYTKYINPLIQNVDVISVFENIENTKHHQVEIELEQKEVFDVIFKQYLTGIIYSSLVNSLISEHSYRRTAMDNANTNSKELIEKLNIQINKIRQANITQEISEIVSGSESLKEE